MALAAIELKQRIKDKLKNLPLEVIEGERQRGELMCVILGTPSPGSLYLILIYLCIAFTHTLSLSLCPPLFLSFSLSIFLSSLSSGCYPFDACSATSFSIRTSHFPPWSIPPCPACTFVLSVFMIVGFNFSSLSNASLDSRQSFQCLINIIYLQYGDIFSCL